MRSRRLDHGSRYGGIDGVKLLAALLVVAIHTGPLLSFDAYAEFLLTGVIGRLAVPFFFMASGFLFFRKLTGDGKKDGRALRRYLTRVAGLYAVAIAIYLPVNLYKGDFDGGVSVGGLVRDILIDGTFYHLWYLPALMTGVTIVYGLRRLPPYAALGMTLALYAIGLLGDSYYGLAMDSELLAQAYEIMFGWFDYTRNGFLFAPVYLAMGLVAAKRPNRKRGQRLYAALFLAGLAGLLLEGILLRDAGLPRHDSMYVMLLPAVYGLFRLALGSSFRASSRLGAVSQWIYLLHPAVIIAIRGAAETLGLEEVLVEQSLIHYAAVCAVAAAVSAGIARATRPRRTRAERVFKPLNP